ncbi:MAG: sensor histidine kinase [Candidatus Limnocylindrales bacterium]
MTRTEALSHTATPAQATLARARERQQAVLRVFHALALVALVLVEVTGVGGTPHPSLSGTGLAMTLALVGFAVGTTGGLFAGELPAPLMTALLLLLSLSSGALYWLQPDGPGILGSFIAVAAAALRLPRRSSSLVGAVALFALAVPEAYAPGHSLGSVLLTGTGVAAFYVMGELSHRLLVGQELANRLLAELEESQQARAEAAALGERQRVAREMHDVLAHSLSGLVLQLEAARLLAQRSGADSELRATVERALHLGKSGLTEARRAIGMLRGDELPGPEALTALVGEFERDAGVRCTLDITGPEHPLQASAALTLYRVAQEALTNVRRHAHPDSVTVRLAYEPDGTRLTVEDLSVDGATAPGNGDAGEGGYGITGMRERAELLGGRLEAGPTEHGFRVELWVPA